MKCDVPVAVVRGSKVAGSEADMVPTDTMSQMTQGKQERVGWDQGIRNHRSLIRDDHPSGDDPDMDVRMLLEVGEQLQDGNIRRYGDVCDSLDLWDGDLGGAHDHRRPDLDTDLSEKALGTHAAVGVGSSGLAQGASGPEADHARRILQVGLAAERR